MNLDRKLLLVADQEVFYLPNLMAKLAKSGHVEAIVIRKLRCGFKTKLKRYKKLIGAFGIKTLIVVLFCSFVAKIVDKMIPGKFYSLEKVSRVFGIKLYYVNKIHSKEFIDILKSSKTKTVFSQVSARLRKELLSHGTFINRHCGHLPSYAGVNPVFWAMLNKEEELAVTLHMINEEYDDGEILKQSTIPTGKHSFFSAYHELFDICAELFVNLLEEQKTDRITHNKNRSYYGWPKKKDRVAFCKEGKRFGIPFRFHNSL